MCLRSKSNFFHCVNIRNRKFSLSMTVLKKNWILNMCRTSLNIIKLFALHDKQKKLRIFTCFAMDCHFLTWFKTLTGKICY